MKAHIKSAALVSGKALLVVGVLAAVVLALSIGLTLTLGGVDVVGRY